MPILSGIGGELQIVEDPRPLYEKAAHQLLKSIDSDEAWAPFLRSLVLHLDNYLERAKRLLSEMLSHREQWLPYIGRFDTFADKRLRETLEISLKRIVTEALDSLVHHLPNDDITNDILSIADFAANHVSNENAINAVNIENIESAENIDNSVKIKPNSNARSKPNNIHLCKNLKTWPGNQLSDKAKWLGLAELFLTEENALRKSVSIRQGFPPAANAENKEEKAYFKEMKQKMLSLLDYFSDLDAQGKPSQWMTALQNLHECPPETYSDKQWQTVESLVVVLPILAAELMLVFQEEGQVDFAEVSLAAERGLGSSIPSDLLLRLDYQIRHILVDEFQDTSIAQLRLLERLMSGWSREDGRTLFLVGDPMQSIYRFRQAEVGLFLKAKAEGIGGIPLHSLCLTNNFRSDPKLVNWVSDYFSSLFPEEDNIVTGAVKFHASYSACTISPLAEVKMFSMKEGGNEDKNENLDDSKSEIKYQDKKESMNEEIDEAEDGNEVTSAGALNNITKIAEIIHSTRANDPKGTLAILVRSRSQLKNILPGLQNLGIQYQGIELDLLIDKPIINDLLTLTRAIFHLSDRIAWLGLLRTPWCFISLRDLYLITHHESRLPLWWSLERFESIEGLSKDAKACLNRMVPILKETLNNRDRLPCMEWVQALWLNLGGGMSVQSSQDAEDAKIFFSILEQEQIRNNLTFIELGKIEEKFRNIYANGTMVSAEKDDANILQVMTIHKSKGLEFDTVIVYGIGKRTRSDQEKLLLWEERAWSSFSSSLILAPIKAKDSSDPVYQYLKTYQQRRAFFEEQRLQYVAMTRAKKQLYIFK